LYYLSRQAVELKGSRCSSSKELVSNKKRKIEGTTETNCDVTLVDNADKRASSSSKELVSNKKRKIEVDHTVTNWVVESINNVCTKVGKFFEGITLLKNNYYHKTFIMCVFIKIKYIYRYVFKHNVL